MVQSLQSELDKLASEKQAGLERLRQLSGQQQRLHEQLDLAQQESTSGNRQLERLQRENRALQASAAEHCWRHYVH